MVDGGPALGLSYSLENDARFKQTLKDAGEVVNDLRIPFGLISRDFYRSERAIFKLQGPGLYPPFKNSVRKQYEQDGVGVKRLSPKKQFDVVRSIYQERKKKKYGFDYPLLVASGKLAASITQPNAPFSINQIGNMFMVIGTSVPYGIYHQSDSPRKVIPQRKFVFIGPEAPSFATSDQQGRLERWLGYIEDYAIKSYIKKGIVK
jgi:phage gpG-like protein